MSKLRGWSNQGIWKCRVNVPRQSLCLEGGTKVGWTCHGVGVITIILLNHLCFTNCVHLLDQGLDCAPQIVVLLFETSIYWVIRRFTVVTDLRRITFLLSVGPVIRACFVRFWGWQMGWLNCIGSQWDCRLRCSIFIVHHSSYNSVWNLLVPYVWLMLKMWSDRVEGGW